MSYFSDALNEALDEIKDTQGVARSQFSEGIRMPNSTLASYANGREPDIAAITQITSGFPRPVGLRLVQAQLRDRVPPEWRDEILQITGAASDVALTNFHFLPDRYLRDLRILAIEGLRNPQLVDYIRDLIQLLNLPDPKDEEWPERPKNFRVIPAPAKAVASKSPPLPPTPTFEEQSRAAETEPKSASNPIPRARSTRPGIAKTTGGQKPPR